MKTLSTLEVKKSKQFHGTESKKEIIHNSVWLNTGEEEVLSGRQTDRKTDRATDEPTYILLFFFSPTLLEWHIVQTV